MNGRRLLLTFSRRRWSIQSAYTCERRNAVVSSCKDSEKHRHNGAALRDFDGVNPLYLQLRLFSVDACLDPISQCSEASLSLKLGAKNTTKAVSTRNRGLKCSRKIKRNEEIMVLLSSQEVTDDKTQDTLLEDSGDANIPDAPRDLNDEAICDVAQKDSVPNIGMRDDIKQSEKCGKSRSPKVISDIGALSTKINLSDPSQVFQILLVSKPSGLLKHEKDALAQVFRHFLEDGWARQQALFRCYVSSVVFPIAVSRFRKFFLSRCTPDIRTKLLELGPSEDGDMFLFPLFSEFSSREFPAEIARYKALVERADLTKPHTWFPFARAMNRKIIYHSGPTNSGKTYNAIQRFKAAASGVYCGPLRLLAMEIFDNVNAEGVYCSLTTGQEKKEVPFANHVSCTVEMVSTQKTWEVAVIDEIQMLADEFRGWAWTRAFLGLQANEIHVCGDPSALSLVKDICAITGDQMEEYHYERFEPLTIDKDSLEGKYGHIQPGDCIVSFSRKEIFSIKRAVELATSNRCCVIYGALPPETRKHQAKLFNDPNSGFDVLVATDAVGMGLNLNIRRVVFHSLEKFDGKTQIKVPASQVKQIAGRAGRRGTLYQIGTATTFYSRDIPYLVQCMEEPFLKTSSAGLFPMYEQIELFATQMPEATFSKLLDRFAETCRLDGSFFLCRNDNLKKVAGIIDKVKGLTLEDKMSFILAPVNSRDPRVINALLSFALAYSKKLPVHLAMATPMGSAKSIVQLMDLETRHQILSLYLWLSHHFPEEYFPQKEQAGQMAADIAFLLGESLAQTDIRIIQKDYPGPSRKRATRRSSRYILRT